MSEDFKVMGFELTSNMEVQLHTQEELEHLAKRHVINKQCLQYKQQVYPSSCSSNIGWLNSECLRRRASREGSRSIRKIWIRSES